MTTTGIPTERAGSLVAVPRAEPAREAIDGRVLDQLADAVIHDLFHLGLSLQTVLPLLSGDAAHRLDAAVDETDRIIRHVRNVVFAMRRAGQ